METAEDRITANSSSRRMRFAIQNAMYQTTSDDQERLEHSERAGGKSS